jgi:hypothetical protein
VHAAGFVILTANPIAGHDAKGQRREPSQDDPDAAGAQDLDPDRRQAPAPDHRRARQTAMPENAAAEPTATAQAATAQQ